ncbi:MAG: hypothetical protein Ct9H300mP16_06820 [Pseudomonadota bacterium]|nr:MAG: hypothetical protein Ct9H300mP16_06820 [Pseudomonadota bacterium]
MIEQDLIDREQAGLFLTMLIKIQSFLAQILQDGVTNRERIYHCASEEFGMPFLTSLV